MDSGDSGGRDVEVVELELELVEFFSTFPFHRLSTKILEKFRNSSPSCSTTSTSFLPEGKKNS